MANIVWGILEPVGLLAVGAPLFSASSEDDCVVPAGSKTPSQICPMTPGLILKIRNWFFQFFIVIRIGLMTYRLCWTTVKYYKTYGKMNVAEIWILLMTLIKLFILLPIYWLHEMNMLFTVFALNSICTQWLNYMLSQRMAVALELGPRHVKNVRYVMLVWLFLFLALIFAMPLFDGSNSNSDSYILVLSCDTRLIYPPRFLFLFGMDFVVATINLIVILCSPKMRNEKDRLRQMRRYDAVNVTNEVKVSGLQRRNTLSTSKGVSQEVKRTKSRTSSTGRSESESQSFLTLEPEKERRTTEQTHQSMRDKADEKVAEYNKHSVFDLKPRISVMPLNHHKSDLNLTMEQIEELDAMEQWHFLSLQIWINDIGNFITALFQFFVFVAAIFSMDYVKNSPEFVIAFGFECVIGENSRWYTKRSAKSLTLWELHILIVFMYSFIIVLVLSVLPYKYNRLKKTESEMKADADKLEKQKKRRQKKHRKWEKKQKKNELIISQDMKQSKKDTIAINSLKRQSTLMPRGTNLEQMDMIASLDASRGTLPINAHFSINAGDDGLKMGDEIGGKKSFLLGPNGEGEDNDIVKEESSDTSSQESHSLSSGSDNDKS